VLPLTIIYDMAADTVIPQELVNDADNLKVTLVASSVLASVLVTVETLPLKKLFSNARENILPIIEQSSVIKHQLMLTVKPSVSSILPVLKAGRLITSCLSAKVDFIL
jgi:hypothetical protein